MKTNKLSFNPFPAINTKRLLLRRLLLEDAPEVYFLRTDTQVNQFVKRPQPKNLIEAEQFIAKINQGIDNNENIYWAIAIKGSDKMIGSISLWHFSENQKIAEVGYDLHTKLHGKGYMSEALRAVLNYGFKNIHLEQITAFTQKNNLKSLQLLRKHRFLLEEGRVDESNIENAIFSINKPVFNNKSR